MIVNFFKSFFDGVSHTDTIRINTVNFYKNDNIIYFEHLDRKFEIFFKGELYNCVVFSTYTIKAYQIILPYLMELKIKYYYITASAVDNYPNDFFDIVESRRYYKKNVYLHDIYSAIIIYKDSDYNIATNSYLYDHYVKYNNKNKKIQKFEKMGYDWREPVFRYIFDNDLRPNLEKFLKNYFRHPINEAEMALYDNWLRSNKLKELLDSLE